MEGKCPLTIMVTDGKISGGDGAPEECRALSGFHVKVKWAVICKQSATQYGPEGQRQRSAEEKAMFKEVDQYVGHPNVIVVDFGPDVVWPKEIAEALGKGADEGGDCTTLRPNFKSCRPSSKISQRPRWGYPISET